MTKNKSKLLGAVAMMVVSAIAVTTASYAWFTMNKEVSATNLELTAAAPTNVKICLTDSANDADWVDNVTLTAANKKLKPVSTITGFNDSFYDSTLNIEAATNPDKAGMFKAVTNPTGSENYAYYYEQDLYFKTKGQADIDLLLSKLDLTASANLNGAVRVAFVDGTDGAKNSVGGATNLIYSNPVKTYKGAATTDTSVNITTKIPTATDTVVKLAKGADESTWGASTHIRVRIYLEGQDPACVNANAANKMSVALTFAAKTTLD